MTCFLHFFVSLTTIHNNHIAYFCANHMVLDQIFGFPKVTLFYIVCDLIYTGFPTVFEVQES